MFTKDEKDFINPLICFADRVAAATSHGLTKGGSTYKDKESPWGYN